MKRHTLKWAAVAAGVAASSAGSTSTQAQTSDAALNALVKKGILTEQEAKEALASVEKEKPKTVPYVLPWGKESQLKLGGFIQVNAEAGDVGSLFGNFSDNPKRTANHVPIHDRFFLRRARINVSGDFLEHFDFKLEGDFSNGDGIASSRTAFSGTDLFLNWHQFPEVNIKAGQYKAPFGLEQLTSDTTLLIAERSQVTGALTPERQLGVQLWGKPLFTLCPDQKDLLDYSVGVFNGNGRNTTLNDDSKFMYAGRLVATPFTGKVLEQDVKWKLGANAYYSAYGAGTRLGPSGNLKFNNLTAAGALTADADGSLSAFTVPAGNSAESTAWGFDQTLTIGPFDLVTEYLEEKVRPKTAGAFHQFTANGYYVQGSYYFPHRKFQLVGRWESFNPGQTAHDDLESVIGGVNYYLKGDHLKFMVNYVHTWSDFRDHNSGTGKDQFDMFLARAQLMF